MSNGQDPGWGGYNPNKGWGGYDPGRGYGGYNPPPKPPDVQPPLYPPYLRHPAGADPAGASGDTYIPGYSRNRVRDREHRKLWFLTSVATGAVCGASALIVTLLEYMLAPLLAPIFHVRNVDPGWMTLLALVVTIGLFAVIAAVIAARRGGAAGALCAGLATGVTVGALVDLGEVLLVPISRTTPSSDTQTILVLGLVLCSLVGLVGGALVARS